MKGPIIEKLANKIEVDISNALTRESSPIMLQKESPKDKNNGEENNNGNVNKSPNTSNNKLSRFSEQMIVSRNLSQIEKIQGPIENSLLISNFNDNAVQMELYHGVKEFSTMYKIAVYFMIPESFYGNRVKNCQSTSSSTLSPINQDFLKKFPIKNKLVIRNVSISINSNNTIKELIKHSILDVNDLLMTEAFPYRVIRNFNNLTCRACKKSGYPDFDLPSKFFNLMK